MSYEILIAFTIFAMATSMAPGPNNIMLMASGVNYGFVKTIPHILGVVCGFGVICLCVGFGLGTLFQLYPQLFIYLKVFALIYLVYLSWRIAFSKVIPSSKTQKSRPMTFIEVCLFQWVNPKAWVMIITAMTLYTNVDEPVLSVLLISLIFAIINLPTHSIWAILGVVLRKFLSKERHVRIFNMATGALLILSIIPVVFIG